jgi:DNA-binding Lrp family transcriptional regulator
MYFVCNIKWGVYHIFNQGDIMAEMNAIDMKRLWILVHEGRSVQEIMQELHIKDMAMVNNALQKLIEEKNLTGTGGLVGEPALSARYTVDGIRISPAMLSGKGFKPGDQFQLKVEGDSIILEKRK